MNEAAGNGPKYRPSGKWADCWFITETSPFAMALQHDQIGSARSRLSRSRVSPISILSTVTMRLMRQTVWPESASTFRRGRSHADRRRAIDGDDNFIEMPYVPQA